MPDNQVTQQAANASQAVRRILAKHGNAVLNDSKTFGSVLVDYCPRQEVSLLVAALEERVPQQILAGGGTFPADVILGNLRQQLVRQRGFSNAAAEWAVRTWIDALQPSQVVR